MSMAKTLPSTPRNENSKPDSDVWTALMQAALRVHRYHATKATAAARSQPGDRAAEGDVSESESAEPARQDSPSAMTCGTARIEPDNRQL